MSEQNNIEQKPRSILLQNSLFSGGLDLMRCITLSLVALVLGVTAPTAGSVEAAQITGATVDSGNILLSVDYDSVTYSSGTFIGTTVVTYNDSNTPQVVNNLGNGSPTFSPNSDASFDGDLDTGLANFDDMTVEFATPLINGGNAVIVLADVGYSVDAFTATINGNDISIAAGGQDFDFGLFTTNFEILAGNVGSVSGGVNAPGGLNAVVFSGNPGSVPSGRTLTSFNLSDVPGLAPGATVTSMTITASGFDAMEVFALTIPEPSSCLLLTCAASALALHRKRPTV